MKRKVFSILFALVLVVSLSLIPASSAAAYSYDDYTGAITKTANRLVALQSMSDYGWDWIVTDLTAHSGGPSRTNLYGVTALGLIDAYQETNASSYLDKAGLVADMMIGYGTDYEGFHAANLGQSWDLRFLKAYAEEKGDTSYSDFAEGYWAWIKDPTHGHPLYADGSQEAFYQFYISYPVSPGYAVWDCADFGLTALAMDDTSWASDMAVVVNSHLGEIEATDECRFIGWAKALELLNAVGPTTYATQITTLIDTLKGTQDTNGNWVGTTDQGTVQNTAYVVMGLASVGEANSVREAVAKAADWFVTNQLTNGGWLETDGEEYSEVDSEALQAIAAVLDISGSVSMTASYIPKIGISVTPISVDFGSVTPGTASATKTVAVTNTGNVVEDFSATLENISTPDVYTIGLKIGTSSVSDWSELAVEIGQEKSESLILTVPSGTAPGTYTATLVFWAEMH